MDQAEWRFDTKTYFSSRPSTRGIISALLATPVMDKRERLRTLAAKLAAIEQDRHAELAAGEGGSEPIDARAEARANRGTLRFSPRVIPARAPGQQWRAH